MSGSETDPARLAGMSDEAVRAKTGRDWADWVRWLDDIGAETMPHKEIAERLYREFDFGGWWAQTVTVGYERIKGLRAIGQRRDGSYEANKSRTFPVPVGELYRAFSSARLRRRWLGDDEPEVRKATPETSIRWTWGDGTLVECYFTSKGDSRSQVAIQHRKLRRQTDAAARKRYWAERLTRLGEVLARPG